MVEIVKATYFVEETEGGEYPINSCPGAYNTETLEVHVIEKPKYGCQNCNLTFTCLKEYDHHNMELHNVKKHTCLICTASFQRRDHLKRHTQSLHLNQIYAQCPVCRKDCKRQDLLLKHIKRKHTAGPQEFHCRECEFKCGAFSVLEKHEASHLVTEKHKCPQCGTAFKRKDHMLRHLKSQHLNQHVSCPVCSQNYKRKDHLVRHVREKHKMGYLNGQLVKTSDIVAID